MKKLLLATMIAVGLASAGLLAQTNPSRSTTLSTAINASQQTITVASATGFAAGVGLYYDGEYAVVAASYVSASTQVPVLRGQLGTIAKAHPTATTVILGPVAMFQVVDAGPGTCPQAPNPYLVSVNVIAGNVWWCDANRKWTATNTRVLTYNSLTIS